MKNLNDKFLAIWSNFLIWRELFYFFSLALAILGGLELFIPNIVLAYFNLNYLVILWLGAALRFLFSWRPNDLNS